MKAETKEKRNQKVISLNKAWVRTPHGRFFCGMLLFCMCLLFLSVIDIDKNVTGLSSNVAAGLISGLILCYFAATKNNYLMKNRQELTCLEDILDGFQNVSGRLTVRQQECRDAHDYYGYVLDTASEIRELNTMIRRELADNSLFGKEDKARILESYCVDEQIKSIDELKRDIENNEELYKSMSQRRIFNVQYNELRKLNKRLFHEKTRIEAEARATEQSWI